MLLLAGQGWYIEGEMPCDLYHFNTQHGVLLVGRDEDGIAVLIILWDIRVLLFLAPTT
jgi:hypothetical protein